MTPEQHEQNARIQAETALWLAEMNAVVDADQARETAAIINQEQQEESYEETAPQAPLGDLEAFLAECHAGVAREEEARAWEIQNTFGNI